ncbi:helix-turn-helix transcriptional regulator [Brevibacillus sp. SYP-B805]|uniref:helix-turn-helix domain-containing protein n=1 Tax=Brevibacillus sp. SYP-B805 TaxID=1578199 RepID=UPI0013EE2839|nr:helix-turn-helix transcriptional regulator [Brevibacillus sp. SYP-B805]
MASFHERLKALRQKHNLKQKDVAKKLGITVSAYGYYEQGRREPSVETLNQLAALFDVSVDYLVNGRRAVDFTLDELLQEKVDDPDDYFFLDGYLHATVEEKKEIRRYYYELKKQMRENNIKPIEPPSLFDITEEIKKGPKND